MSRTYDDDNTNYTYDLPRMEAAVEGRDSEEVIELSGAMTPEEVQQQLEQAYYRMQSLEG
ncbi:hypothetical protein ACQ5ES_05310 [Pseudidiomarina sp. E22-M8]|uniref:hypothetical protein n=1 Tax=Pseudidiomarina sp. E22-M8 TaxID=3424768 RepID=UPI00403C72B8